jgi:cytochrome P450
MGWVLYCISQHPEVQAQLSSELEAAGLLAGGPKPPRSLTWDDLAALPYLDAVIKVFWLPLPLYAHVL